MEAAVLIGGLSVFIVATGIYLRGAYQRAPLWAWSSAILPPIALVFYSLYWRRTWQLFALHAVGLVLIVLGSILYLRSSPVNDTLPLLSSLRPSLAPASLNKPLDIEAQEFASSSEVKPYIGRIDGLTGGRLFGEEIKVQQVELDDGVLRFKKGEGVFPQREVAIFLGITEYDIEDSWELSVNPTTDNPPIIHVSKYDARYEQLHTRVYDGGYWLELELTDRRANQLSGFVRLLLPGGSKDFIAGNFESYTDQLRYIAGEVDRFHDSTDTIEYVANLHLETKFKKAVKSVTFAETHYMAHVATPTADTIAHLTLVDGSMHTIELNLFKGEHGWTVDTHSTDDLKVAIETLVFEPPAAGKQNIEPELNIYAGNDYKSLIGKEIKVVSKQGKVREGRLKAIKRSQLVLLQPVGKGYMSVFLPTREVEQVVILN